MLAVKLSIVYGAAFGSAPTAPFSVFVTVAPLTKSTMLLAIGPMAGPSSLNTSSWPMFSGVEALSPSLSLAVAVSTTRLAADSVLRLVRVVASGARPSGAGRA